MQEPYGRICVAQLWQQDFFPSQAITHLAAGAVGMVLSAIDETTFGVLHVGTEGPVVVALLVETNQPASGDSLECSLWAGLPHESFCFANSRFALSLLLPVAFVAFVCVWNH